MIDDEQPSITGDRPKERLIEDRLGYAPFAQAIARSIIGLRSTDGVVLAIHGAWGSGKTSAVNMVIDALGRHSAESVNRQEIVLVRFNPWWFSEQQDLTRAFFVEVTAALGGKVSQKIIDRLRGVAKRVTGAKELTAALLNLVPGGSLISGIGSEAIAAAGSAFDNSTSLDQERASLQDALKDEGKRILVVIDDIDRLPADEARQIFRLVKSVGDLPNVIYLLVFDREIARRALDQPTSPADPNGWRRSSRPRLIFRRRIGSTFIASSLNGLSRSRSELMSPTSSGGSTFFTMRSSLGFGHHATSVDYPAP